MMFKGMSLEVVFPLQSVAVMVTELIPGPSSELQGGDWVILSDDAGQHASVAVKKFITQGTRQFVTLTVSGPDKTGPALSKPTTLTPHWLELPQLSVTVTVTNWLFPETIVPAGGDCVNTNWLGGVQPP